MDDLTEGLLRLAAPQAPSRLTLAVTGPEKHTLTDIIYIGRTWLGFGPARIVSVPGWMMQPVIRTADLLGILGVETALRSTSFKQTEKPNVADHQPFADATGLTMRRISDALAADPASSADKRDARLAAPLIFLRSVLALFWIATGIITLASMSSATGANAAIALSGLVGSSVTLGVIVATSCLDIALGVWLLIARNLLYPCAAHIALSLGYLGGLTVLAPEMWMDPLGPLLKVIPVVAATLILASSGARR